MTFSSCVSVYGPQRPDRDPGALPQSKVEPHHRTMAIPDRNLRQGEGSAWKHVSAVIFPCMLWMLDTCSSFNLLIPFKMNRLSLAVSSVMMPNRPGGLDRCCDTQLGLY